LTRCMDSMDTDAPKAVAVAEAEVGVAAVGVAAVGVAAAAAVRCHQPNPPTRRFQCTSMDTDAPKTAVAAVSAVGAVAAAAVKAEAEGAVGVAAAAAAVRCRRKGPPTRRFQCTQCDTSWPSANALTSHKFTHSGERPYKCTECDKCFSQSCNLKSHVFAVHRRIKFQCMLCLHYLSTATNLSKHIEKTHNPAARVRCNECWMHMRGDLVRHKKSTLHRKMAAVVMRKKGIMAETRALMQRGLQERKGIVGMLDALKQLAGMRAQVLNGEVLAVHAANMGPAAERAAVITLAAQAAEVRAAEDCTATATPCAAAAATADECSTHSPSPSAASDAETTLSCSG